MKRCPVSARAIAAVTALALAGCSASAAKATDETITVFAASSLTGTFGQIATAFEKANPGVHVRLNFGASSTLATSIVNGAPADVFASAAVKNMTTVVSAGEAAQPVTFATNSMQIAAAPGNPAHIAAVADLARSGVKVALCEPTVPCGAVAAQVFANAHVTVKAVSLESDVKSTLAKVELGEVDAGVVYVTDVQAAGTKVVGVPIPAAVNATTKYPIAALTHSTHAALAQRFVDFVNSSAGQAVLRAAGFAQP
jgi:molybdate transport system substrate-binding protein